MTVWSGPEATLVPADLGLSEGQTRRPDTWPPCRTVVGLFPRRGAGTSWDENDPDYVPDSPPGWARAVDIG